MSAPTQFPHFVAPECPSSLKRHWQGVITQSAAPMAAVRSGLRTIIERDCTPSRGKGRPNANLIRREIALRLEALLFGPDGRMQDPLPAAALEVARELAATELTDAVAFGIWINLASITNSSALKLASANLTSNVVMHMSCLPRIERARESLRSFASAEREGISQVIVIGSEQAWCYEFDAATRVLTVPVPDSYEHLPAKAISAFAFFALCGTPDCVLKVDDDHRLKDVGELLARFAAVRPARLYEFLDGPLKRHSRRVGSVVSALSMGRYFWVHQILNRTLRPQRQTAVQMGLVIYDSTFFEYKCRTWHYGKCADPALNSTPFTFPGARDWVNGAGGYFLNRGALMILL